MVEETAGRGEGRKSGLSDTRSPYDTAFQDTAFETQHFPDIRAEAEQRAISTADPEQFLELSSVGAILRTALVESDQPAVTQFGPLLHQAYHFWLFGKNVYDIDEPLFRQLTGDLPVAGARPLVPPAPAGYLALPRNLLWARIADDAVPEAIDGFFWTMLGEGDPRLPPFARLDVLLVLGLRPGRPGFSIAEVSALLADEPAEHWADARAREEPQQDFANILPGGEIQQLRAIETRGEVLKFIARAFGYGMEAS
jgi:hypothetical protein